MTVREMYWMRLATRSREPTTRTMPTRLSSSAMFETASLSDTIPRAVKELSTMTEVALVGPRVMYLEPAKNVPMTVATTEPKMP